MKKFLLGLFIALTVQCANAQDTVKFYLKADQIEKTSIYFDIEPYSIIIKLNPVATGKLLNFTQNNIGEYAIIYIKNIVFSEAIIKGAITSGILNASNLSAGEVIRILEKLLE